MTIEQATKTENASGELTASWATWITRFAEVEPLRAQESVIGNRQTVAEVGYRIRLHSDSQTRQITPQMRVQYQGRTLEIGGQYDEGERREFVILRCTERVGT